MRKRKEKLITIDKLLALENLTIADGEEFLVVYNPIVSKEVFIDGKLVDSKNRKLEAFRFIKLYNTPEAEEAVMKLSGGACKLLFHIMFTQFSGDVDLYLDRKEVMKKLGIKENTYINYINELINAFIIKKLKVVNNFISNPKIFFKGSRIERFPDKLMDRTKYYERKNAKKYQFNDPDEE